MKAKKSKKKTDFFRIIAKVYYPLQFVLIYLLYFGFTLEPVDIVLKSISAFHIEEVLRALYNFKDVFAAGFTYESFLFFIIMFIPYAIMLLWSAKYIIIFSFVLFEFVQFLLCLFRSRLHKKSVLLNKQVQVHNGAPGTGKTWLLVLFFLILSDLMWKKLSWLHWRDKTKIERWQAENNTVKIDDWQEVEESYKYYLTPQKVDVNGKEREILPIHCGFSNIGIEHDGKMSSKLTFEHAAQLERVPSYTISLWSEFGTTYNIEYSVEKMLQMSDDLRFCRQFRENVILGDEQDATNIAIDARRVVSEVLYMTECKIILQPFLFNIFFKPLKWFFTKTQKFNKIFSGFMTMFEKLINHIGFVKFQYIAEGSTEHQRKNKKGVFMSPMWSGAKYDTRAFRQLADCRKKAYKGEVHTSLTMADTPENRQAYLRAEFKNRPEVFYTNTNELQKLNREDEFWNVEILKDKLEKYREKYPQKYAAFINKYGLGKTSESEGKDKGKG